MLRTKCGVQFKGGKRSKNLMLMLGLKKNINELAMANSARWCGHVLRKDHGHVLRNALCFEVEGQRKKGRLNKIRKKQVEKDSVKIGLRWEDAICRSKLSFGASHIAARLR